MRFTSFTIFAGLAAVANAHFHLQYPAPRGNFVEDDEPTFCDGYNNAVSNRTSFPLSGGFITLTSEHPSWTLGILVSTVQNPTSFDNFTSGGKNQFLAPFASFSGEGAFCLPVDLLSANATGGLKDGQNVTLEFVFDGGDGALYQCADLTLSSNASESGVSCSNATSTSSSSSSSSTSTSGALGGASTSSGIVAGILGVMGFAMAL
ncbi:hypothetical protein PLICRDRAFT_35650 [Plicaturopsis crispa FD-325 SS-3]|nr:hypothetical protein PLICRDRAFT_35650 [Plicaturopsis crispa FD-325 SS-3]